MKRKKNPNQKPFKFAKKAPVILPKPSVEEVGANIGSEENVSFAMSIALQMKEQQRKADEAKKSRLPSSLRSAMSSIPTQTSITSARSSSPPAQ